jgi:hypothetical protein
VEWKVTEKTFASNLEVWKDADENWGFRHSYLIILGLNLFQIVVVMNKT